jgi:hypothetical protein
MSITALICAAMFAPNKVAIIRKGSGFELIRDGKPYVVRGAGAKTHLDALVASGGNSTRTWGSVDIGPFLDEAHAKGLTVTVGIWLGHVEHGFDYDNKKQVDEQFEMARKSVEMYKDHPAVLMWAVGNEMELGAKGTRVFEEIERIAKMIKKADKNHPVISVVADMWPEKMTSLLKFCPSLDALGVNSYGGLPTLEERMKPWQKPYFITEFAFDIPQPRADDPKGVLREPSSTEKCAMMEAYYAKGIANLPGRVLGSYVFYWDPTEVGLASRYNMHLKDKTKLQMVDVMQKIWTGAYPKNRAPEVNFYSDAVQTVAPGGKLEFSVSTDDPERNELELEYQVLSDDPKLRFVGDHEKEMRIFSSGKIDPDFEITAPKDPGIYRILVIVRDGKGSAGTASLPFLVK